MKFHQLPLPLKKILPTPLALTLNHYLSLVTALKQCFAVRGALMQVKYLNYHHPRVVFGVFAMKLETATYSLLTLLFINKPNILKQSVRTR